MTVVVPHERFTAELAFASGIPKPAGDLFLQIKMQYVCGAPGRVMQVCAQAQKKIVCSLDPALIAFAQPVFADQLVGTQRTLFKVGDPKQILIVAQPAAATLQIWFLQKNTVAEFFVAGDLIVHAHLDVVTFVAHNAFCAKLLPKFSSQLGVTREELRLQHCGLRAHIAVSLGNGFFDRTRGVSDFESAVPQKIQDLVHHLFQPRRNLRGLSMQEHHIYVAERIELTPAISAKSNERQGQLKLAIFASSNGRRSTESVSQQNIHQFGSARANLASATTGLVP